MNVRVILTIIIAFSLLGCGHYNYAVKRDGSPIPFENKYDNDDNDEYEFYSTLFKVDPEKQYDDLVEITHLNDVYNHHHGTPESTWRKSRLSFNLSKESGVEVITDSVVLEHYTESNERLRPSKIESTISKCSGIVGCREYIILHYQKGMPKKLVEKVRFKVIVNGKEKSITYTIPLEYKYHYSFWDVMMGA
jgi:hypothetical protein